LTLGGVAAEGPATTPTVDQIFYPYNPYNYPYNNYFNYGYNNYSNYYPYSNYYNSYPYSNYYYPYSTYYQSSYYPYSYSSSYYYPSSYTYQSQFASWKWCTLPGGGSKWVWVGTPPAGWFCAG
jgi:hypothetical protein